MELDEMKNIWIALDNRLKENDSLKETLILEMMRTKTNKSLSRLINYEIFSVVVLILAIPYIAYYYYNYSGKFLFADIFIIFAGVFCVASVFWYVYKLYGLMKIDLSNKISDNIFYTNKYNIQIKREKIAMNMVFGPIFIILLVMSYMQIKVSVPLWIFLICLLSLSALLTFWGYKRLYEKNINLIINSLNEIKDLEEKE